MDRTPGVGELPPDYPGIDVAACAAIEAELQARAEETGTTFGGKHAARFE